MATAPEAGGSRSAGLVVDPDVRQDGATEPEVISPVTPEPNSDDAENPSAVGAGASATAPAARGAQVRERLLAKARAAGAAASSHAARLDELESIGRSPAPEEERDVEVAPPPVSGRPPSAPYVPDYARELSPTLVAVFATLVGVAAVASITALFMSLEARFGASAAPLGQNRAGAERPRAVAAPDPKPRPKRARQKLPAPWRLADAKGDARYRFIEGKIGTDSFLKVLEAAGVPEAQGYRVLAAMRGVVDLDRHKKSDRFEALLERGSNKLFALEYLAGPETVYQAKEVDGRLSGSRLDLKLERSQLLSALSYDGQSFERSADLFGFDAGLSKVVQRALDGQMSLDQLERGDVIKVVVQEVTMLGEFSRYAGVEAIELSPIDPKKPRLRLYYSDAEGTRGYYDRDGRAPFEGGWHKPIKSAPRTSPFNPHRLNPVLHKVMPHQGTDFGSPVGTPVGAASAGSVSFVGPAGPAGNLVKILHPGGVETGYAHLSRFAEGLAVGDHVRSQQIIGYVGNTGRSTGPHLHFSASRDGVFFDPETLNLDGMRALTAADLQAFKVVIAKYDPMLDGIPMPERFAPAPAPEVAAVVTAAPAGSAMPTVALGPDDENASDSDDEVAPSGAPPAATTSEPAAPTAASAAPARAGGSSVYLTDKELLEGQAATDDGEVEE